MIHESDSAPGRVNKWAGVFAKKVAVSFMETAEYFSPKKVAWIGQPIRTEIEHPASKKEGLEYFKLETDVPVILVLGGSQGAELINNIVLDALPRLVNNYQIIHQTGMNNFKMVTDRANVVLGDDKNKLRYFLYPFKSFDDEDGCGAAVSSSRSGSMLLK